MRFYTIQGFGSEFSALLQEELSRFDNKSADAHIVLQLHVTAVRMNAR